MARKTIVIENVVRFQQSGVDIFMFAIAATTLVEMGVTLRYWEHPEGVNRRLTVGHAKDIARHLREAPSALMMDPIRGDLRSGDPESDWAFDPKTGTLTGQVEVLEDNRLEGAFFIIDDGQHRHAACEMLDGEDRKKWSFAVTATMGLSKERRLEVFQLKGLEKKQDPKHMLAQRHELGRFRGHAEEVAYLGGMALNERRNSPLKGKVHFQEGPVARADRENGVVSFTSLLGFLKPVAGHDSNVHGFDTSEQIRIIVDWFRAAATVWTSTFGNVERVLGRPIGYCALLRLLSRGRFVHTLLARDYSHANIERVLAYGRGFKWEVGVESGSVNSNNLADRLDKYIRDAEERARSSDRPSEGAVSTGTDG